MKPTLYVHIGHSKVGSTTLQSLIFDNRDVLRSKGIYPFHQDLKVYDGGYIDTPPSRTIENLVLETEDCGEHISDAIKTFQKTYIGRQQPAFLISSENLSNPGRSRIFETVSEIVDIKVIYYVRRRDDLILSKWKQWGIKNGAPISRFIKRWTRKAEPTYLQAIADWKAIGADVTVKPLHKTGLTGGDLQSDFADFIGVDFGQLSPVINQNVSYDYDLLWMLSRNAEVFTDKSDNRIFRALDEFGKAPSAVKRDPLGYEARKEIFDCYQEEYKELHASYFPRLDFDALFGVIKPDSGGDPYTARPAVAGMKTARIAFDVIARQQSEIEELRAKLAAKSKK